MKPSAHTPAPLRNSHLEGGPFLWKNGPVGVLLLHGMTATTAEIRPLACFLHENGYTTAGPLLPGHGTTPEELNQKKWRDWTASAEDAYQYLASICESVFVAGLSMGGLLALYLASGHVEIKGLLLYAPALVIPNARYAAIVSLFAPALRKKSGHPEMPWQGYYVNPTHAVAQLYRLQGEVRQRLDLVTQPTLIVQGRLDQTIAPASSQIVYDQIKSIQKEIHWYGQASHVILLDQDGPTVQRLSLDFIKRITCV